MCHQKLLQSLRSLGKSEACPQIYRKRGNIEGPEEVPSNFANWVVCSGLLGIRIGICRCSLGTKGFYACDSVAADVFPRTKQEDVSNDNKDEEGEDLKGQTAEESVVGRPWIFPRALCDTYERGTNNLYYSGYDIAAYEETENDFGWERGKLAAVWKVVNENGQDGVD